MSTVAQRLIVPKEQRQKCPSFSSTDICLDEEERTFFHLQEDIIIEETVVSLKQRSRHNFGYSYKLGEVAQFRLHMCHQFLGLLYLVKCSHLGKVCY